MHKLRILFSTLQYIKTDPCAGNKETVGAPIEPAKPCFDRCNRDTIRMENNTELIRRGVAEAGHVPITACQAGIQPPWCRRGVNCGNE
jgi:hypothetical protein